MYCSFNIPFIKQLKANALTSIYNPVCYHPSIQGCSIICFSNTLCFLIYFKDCNNWFDESYVSFNFSTWGSGEPNNFRDSEHCAEIWDDLLNDKNCHIPLQFICERPKGRYNSCLKVKVQSVKQKKVLFVKK